jgi:hypothetical protein
MMVALGYAPPATIFRQGRFFMPGSKVSYFPDLLSTNLDNGQVLYFGRQLMTVPAGGLSVRQCSFNLPHLEHSNAAAGLLSSPVVVATVDNQGIGAGTIMAIYSIVWAANYIPGFDELAISAQNINGGIALNGDYHCNVTVIGKSARV